MPDMARSPAFPHTHLVIPSSSRSASPGAIGGGGIAISSSSYSGSGSMALDFDFFFGGISRLYGMWSSRSWSSTRGSDIP